MLRLQIAAEGDRVFEFPAARLEQAHGIAVGNAGEPAFEHPPQAILKPGADKTIEQSQVIRAMLQHMPHAMGHQPLGQLHVVQDVAEGGFGLDHPEFRSVPGRVGVLGAERGPEGVDAPERAGERLPFQLTGDRERRGPAEKVIFRPGRPLRLRGHAEHLARPLAVGTGDQGRMHVIESPRAEIVVHCPCRLRADAEHGAVLVGARAQMRDGAQKFIGMALFLERIRRRIGKAEDLEGSGMHFPFLPLARRFHQRPADADGSSRVHALKILPGLRAFIYDALDIFQA